MSWNYRVLKRETKEGEFFAVHEVFYDDEGNPKKCTVEPVFPQGTSENDLERRIELYREALEKPILNYEDF